MSPQDFQRAINNGLGRANLWLRRNPWQPFTEFIKHVCLHHTGNDPQCEGSRAVYVHDIVSVTGAADHFTPIAINGLRASTEYWDTEHLYHLTSLFALSGNQSARQAMYDKFSRHDAQEPVIGAGRIVCLDGLKGLLVVLDQLGQYLESHPDFWMDKGLQDEATEIIGRDVTAEIETAARGNPHIRRYLDSVQSLECERAQRIVSPDSTHLHYDGFRQQILETGGNVPRGGLPAWGQNAGDSDLIAAMTDALAERDPILQAARLKIFWRRSFPGDPQHLIQLARSTERKVSRAALRALKLIKSDSVRSFAMELASQAHSEADGIFLLIRNFEPGDEQQIISLLGRLTNESDLHWVGHAAVEVFEENITADLLPSITQIYERNNCSLCRLRAMKLLARIQKLPEWMRDECQYDSNADIRKLIAAG